MFKNIGKRIRLLSVMLAILTFAVFLVLAIVFLVAALRAEDPTTRAAGIEGTILFVVLALFLPLFSWVLYGFGKLVESHEKQAADTKEIRDMLKKALSDGALSDEIARKTGIVLAKLPAAATAHRSGVAQTRPVVRPAVMPKAASAPQPAVPVTPVTMPATPVAASADEPVVTEPAAFAESTPAATPGAPVETPSAPASNEPATPLFADTPAEESAPRDSGTPFTPPVPTEPAAAEPFAPNDPTGAVKPIRSLNSDTTY